MSDGIIIDTYINPSWRIGAVVRNGGPGLFIVVCGAIQRSSDTRNAIIDALDPCTSIRVFSDRQQAMSHAKTVVFGEDRPVAGDVSVH